MSHVIGLVLLSTVVFTQITHAAGSITTTIPVVTTHEFIRLALIKQMFRGKNQTARVVDDGSGCYYLDVSRPRIDSRQGYLHVLVNAEARIGKAMGNRCISVLRWDGQIEIFQQLKVAAHSRVKATVVKSNLRNHDGNPVPAGNYVWQWLTRYVHPRLEAVVFDLTEPARSMRDFLPAALPHVPKQDITFLLDSLTIDSVGIRKDGVQFNFKVGVKNRWRTPRQLEPPLRGEEKEKVFAVMRQLDSFYTIIVKHLAVELSADLQRELLTVLLDLRYELTRILAVSNYSVRNPVRRLFLQTWRRLTPIMKAIAEKQHRHQDILQLMSFITAGEALSTLDRAGPSLGIEISGNGLRRLARILLPRVRAPLAYSTRVDPQLRSLFGFGSPIRVSRSHRWDNWISWFLSSAEAAVPMTPKLKDKLNKVIPTFRNLDSYLPLANKALKHSAESQINKGKLDAKYHDTYRWLVLSAAWKESCWRQYVRRKGQRTPLQSHAGAVGIMQIVPKVWRGFYEPKQLKWDFVYNTRAGGEILLHYMRDYAIRKKEHLRNGGIDNLARAAYAAYNAGPRRLSRYRNPKATKRQRQVDESFYNKFLQVKKGQVFEVKSCYAG